MMKSLLFVCALVALSVQVDFTGYSISDVTVINEIQKNFDLAIAQPKCSSIYLKAVKRAAVATCLDPTKNAVKNEQCPQPPPAPSPSPPGSFTYLRPNVNLQTSVTSLQLTGSQFLLITPPPTPVPTARLISITPGVLSPISPGVFTPGVLLTTPPPTPVPTRSLALAPGVFTPGITTGLTPGLFGKRDAAEAEAGFITELTAVQTIDSSKLVIDFKLPPPTCCGGVEYVLPKDGCCYKCVEFMEGPCMMLAPCEETSTTTTTTKSTTTSTTTTPSPATTTPSIESGKSVDATTTLGFGSADSGRPTPQPTTIGEATVSDESAQGTEASKILGMDQMVFIYIAAAVAAVSLCGGLGLFLMARRNQAAEKRKSAARRRGEAHSLGRGTGREAREAMSNRRPSRTASRRYNETNPTYLRPGQQYNTATYQQTPGVAYGAAAGAQHNTGGSHDTYGNLSLTQQMYAAPNAGAAGTTMYAPAMAAQMSNGMNSANVYDSARAPSRNNSADSLHYTNPSANSNGSAGSNYLVASSGGYGTVSPTANSYGHAVVASPAYMSGNQYQ